MRNFVQPGDVITLTMTADTVSGQLINIGKFTGVCANDALNGTENEVAVMGVYTLSKVPGDAYTQGQALHMNPATGLVDATGGTVLFGVAVAAAGAGANTVVVRLTPSAA